MRVKELSDEQVSIILTGLNYYTMYSKDEILKDTVIELEKELKNANIFYGGNI